MKYLPACNFGEFRVSAKLAKITYAKITLLKLFIANAQKHEN